MQRKKNAKTWYHRYPMYASVKNDKGRLNICH